MPKRNVNRSYKRGEPHRDVRLFIIVTEGEREDKYFGWFDRRSQRIRVELVPREMHASAPNHFINRLQQYVGDKGLEPQMGDSIWFVLDLDHWSREAIDNLIDACKQTKNWHIAISNPCFEVWLNFHSGPITNKGAECSDLKTMLGERIRGGFHPNNICPMIDAAIEYAKAADTHPDQDFPDRLQTKVYRLGEAMNVLLRLNAKKET